MHRKLFLAIALLSLLSCGRPTHSAATQVSSGPIAWVAFSDAVFNQARREHKFVLLDLQAVWCHWCHVMDENTYGDTAVIQLVQDHFIAVKVDQDSRPDLANRYEDYGWPATVVFDADGREIVKRQGYIPPKPMAGMLRAIISDPTPGPSVTQREPIAYGDQSALSSAARDGAVGALMGGYDSVHGGWGFVHKYINVDNIEYCMAHTGDARCDAMARDTLRAATALIDPAWGGIYQYSTDGDWWHPHYEKIISFQADGMRIYAQAYNVYHDAVFLDAAQRIHRYVQTFLTTPQGAFYTSQDADLHPGEHSAGYFSLSDAARRRQGIPRIDTHVYARENGWMIQSLVSLYIATGNPAHLVEARRAADWVVAHRSLPGGGFRHGDSDAAGPYLGDTLAMGRAFLALYTAAAQRDDLTRSMAAATFIAGHFQSPAAPGFVTAVGSNYAQVDENIAAARFANLLTNYTGSTAHRAAAQHALRYICDPHTVAGRHIDSGGILLADEESAAPLPHVTVVGPKADGAAQSLYLAALRYPVNPKRLEWLDRAEGPLPGADVEYPAFARSAAYLCTSDVCSSPAFDVASLNSLLQRRLHH